MTGLDLVCTHKAGCDQHVLQAQEPFLVIGAAEIDRRWQHLAIEAGGIDVERALRAHSAYHGKHTAFPLLVEYRLVGLGLDLAETVHAAHVVYAVHEGAPGTFGNPVPIMESRVR